MTIRAAKFEDVPSMVELLQELFALEPDFPYRPDLHTQGLELLLSHSETSVFVAEKNGMLAGMVTLQPHISTGFGCKDAILEDLVVRSSFRSQGLGSALLNTAVQQAKAKGYKRLRLMADRGNSHALGFYEKHGWYQGNMVNLYCEI